MDPSSNQCSSEQLPPSQDPLESNAVSESERLIRGDNSMASDDSHQQAPQIAECRICQDDDILSNLQMPCNCNGTVKYAHRECVQKWINEKGNRNCEICGSQYEGEYTVPDPPQVDEAQMHAAFHPFHPLFSLYPSIVVQAADEDGIAMVGAERERMAVTGSRRIALTYCLTIAMLMVGMILMHQAFEIVETGEVSDSAASAGHNFTSGSDSINMSELNGTRNGGVNVSSTELHIPEPPLSMWVVLVWVLLRTFVVLLPLIVMMRLMIAIREARLSDNTAAHARVVSHVEMNRILQHLEAGDYGPAVANMRGPPLGTVQTRHIVL